MGEIGKEIASRNDIPADVKAAVDGFTKELAAVVPKFAAGAGRRAGRPACAGGYGGQAATAQPAPGYGGAGGTGTLRRSAWPRASRRPRTA